jgi:hypothetical protein
MFEALKIYSSGRGPVLNGLSLVTHHLPSFSASSLVKASKALFKKYFFYPSFALHFHPRIHAFWTPAVGYGRL